MYRKADRLAKRYRREYEKEIIMIDAVRSVSDNDGMPHGTGISKPVEEKAIRLADAAERYIECEQEALRIRQEVFDVIAAIPDEVGDVLYERYINLKPWEDVADAVGYSLRQCHNIHRKGLNMVTDFIELHSIS